MEFNADPNGKTLEEKNAYWALKAHVEENHKDLKFECPRQAESFKDGTKEAIWSKEGGYLSCSWCGSIHPDVLFDAIEKGFEVEPTDKNYKLYVLLPNPEEGKLVEMGSRSGPTVDPRTGEWGIDNPTDDEIISGRYDRPIMGVAEATKRAKFYFQHFDVDEKKRFVELLNQKKMKVGFPGHFYQLPFFIS